MAGKIIVIEGTDCSGKETQTRLLETKLKEAGKKSIRFGFPMYETATGKIVGGCYLGKPEICDSYFTEGAVNVDPHVACLYYAADRKYNMSKIEEYLKDDYYGNIIYDWRSPICSLFYYFEVGKCTYSAPGGAITF